MNRMIAITVRPGAVTAAPRPIAPWLTALTTGAPAPTTTSRKVPNSSENSRRHSREGSAKRRSHGVCNPSSRSSDHAATLRPRARWASTGSTAGCPSAIQAVLAGAMQHDLVL